MLGKLQLRMQKMFLICGWLMWGCETYDMKGLTVFTEKNPGISIYAVQTTLFKGQPY